MRICVYPVRNDLFDLTYFVVCWCEQKVVAQVLKVLERLFLQLINALFTLLMYVIRFWR